MWQDCISCTYQVIVSRSSWRRVVCACFLSAGTLRKNSGFGIFADFFLWFSEWDSITGARRNRSPDFSDTPDRSRSIPIGFPIGPERPDRKPDVPIGNAISRAGPIGNPILAMLPISPDFGDPCAFRRRRPWWSCFSLRTALLVVTSGALCSQLNIWLNEWELWCVVWIVFLLIVLTNWIMILHFWRLEASLTSTLTCHHACMSWTLQPVEHYFERLWEASLYVWFHFGGLSRVSCVTCRDDRKVIPALVPWHHMNQNSMQLQSVATGRFYYI